jgi:hypothetical protein
LRKVTGNFALLREFEVRMYLTRDEEHARFSHGFLHGLRNDCDAKVRIIGGFTVTKIHTPAIVKTVFFSYMLNSRFGINAVVSALTNAISWLSR